MSSYYRRFVGADTLPKSLSKREVEECFGLSIEDIQELRPPRFRGTARLGAAVQLVMLRATGRHPDAFSGLPSVLLWHLTSALGMNATDIASVTSLYKDKDTRYEHQLWARERVGFAVMDGSTKPLLADALTVPKVALNANSADTLQPYEPGKVIGSQDPVLPAPAGGKGGCGGVGRLIMAVVRNRYSFDQLSPEWKRTIDGASEPWKKVLWESNARGTFVHEGVRQLMEDGLIQGAGGYKYMYKGPDIVPSSGPGLKYEITQQTPSLNAIIEHSRRYPNDLLRYVTYK